MLKIVFMLEVNIDIFLILHTFETPKINSLYLDPTPQIFRNCQCTMHAKMPSTASSQVHSYNITGAVANTTLLTPVQSEDRLEEGYAVPGRCQRTTCPYKWPYFVLLWVFFFINTFAVVPAWAGSIR